MCNTRKSVNLTLRGNQQTKNYLRIHEHDSTTDPKNFIAAAVIQRVFNEIKPYSLSEG